MARKKPPTSFVTGKWEPLRNATHGREGGLASHVPGTEFSLEAGDPGPSIPPSLLHDVGGFVEDPEAWFWTPNTAFEGRRPVDLIGTDEEPRLRSRIEGAKLGLFS